MEDSHIADLKMQGGNSLFGVFDGHGGKKFTIKIKLRQSRFMFLFDFYVGSEVAIFVKNHFSAEL